MKKLLKKIGLLIAVMFSVMLFHGKTIAQVPYGIFDETTGTLTLGYGQILPNGAVVVNPSVSQDNYIGSSLAPAQNVKKVVFDKSFADYKPYECYCWFRGCKNLLNIDHIENLKTDNVMDMYAMFSGCSGLTSLDISNFKTENVTRIAAMFRNCSSLTNLDISGFKTNNVTDMCEMFDGCRSLTSLDLSSFETDNVTNMHGMFRYCSNLTSLDVSNFITDNVTKMDEMFSSCSSLTNLDVSNFKTDNVTNMYGMFRDCSNLTSLDVSNFKTDNVTNMSDMFRNCSSLTSLDLSNFKTDNVTDMSSMFNGCSSLTSLDVSNFKTDNVKYMDFMFADCSNLTSLDVSSFKTDNVTYMGGMFHSCSSLTSLNVSGFHTGNVNGISYMFYGCSSVTSLDVSNFNTENVINMHSMFEGCSCLTSLDVSNFKTDNVTDMCNMFEGCSCLTSLDVSNFKTDNATNMSNMFHGCSSLTCLDVRNFKTDNVTNMWCMFANCKSLTSLDASNFITDNVTDMSSMFNGCRSLTSLDVSSFKTENVTYMGAMFYGCSSLKTIYVGDGWNTNAVQSADNMFEDCDNLVGVKGTKYTDQGKGIEYAHIDGGEDNPGYFTAVPMLLSITNLPSKYEYVEGELFSADGGVLTVVYKNLDTYSPPLSDAEITGFDNTKLGEQKLTVSYLGLETTFNVKVVAKSPVSVAIKALPNKVEYITGQDFSIDGGVLTVTFNNGTTEDVALKSDDIKISGFDKNKAGEQTVTIEYLGQTATFSVKVTEDSKTPVSEISASTCTVDVFPNPVKSGEEITIKVGGNVDFSTSKILIYNSVGTVVLQISNVEEYNRITLKSGVYTGVLITRSGKKTFRVAVK